MNKNQCKYFIILEFEKESLRILKETFSFLEEFDGITINAELHFTILYMTGSIDDEDVLKEHFKDKLNDFKKFEISVSSFWNDNGYLILNFEKDESLNDFHTILNNDLPKEIQCINSDFNKWEPHTGLAKLSTTSMNPLFLKEFEIAVNKLSSRKLLLKGIKLTQRYNNNFRTIFP